MRVLPVTFAAALIALLVVAIAVPLSTSRINSRREKRAHLAVVVALIGWLLWLAMR